jgi:hypothetical protein
LINIIYPIISPTEALEAIEVESIRRHLRPPRQQQGSPEEITRLGREDID